MIMVSGEDYPWFGCPVMFGRIRRTVLKEGVAGN
jgi:hypothetical protein